MAVRKKPSVGASTLAESTTKKQKNDGSAAVEAARQQGQIDYVLRTVEERRVRYVQLWFTDVLGSLKSFAITPAELENAFEEGLTFDGSAIDGFSRHVESDMLALPDADTFELLPWRTDDPVARIFCNISTLEGTPFLGDTRQVLRRALDRASALGYRFYASSDLEYFYFADNDPSHPPKPLDTSSYFDLSAADSAGDLRRRTIGHLEALGIPVRYSHHEEAPSQQEIDLRYTDALTMADSIMTCRLVVKEVAMERGVYATFMPKPIAGVQGNGMHTHLSLFKGDENAFYDADDPASLSPTAKAFLAGILRHAREITAITNQWVNSYKRLVVGYEAPVYVSWARYNRSALVRVPTPKRGKASSTRIEYRAPDPACNPYLAYTVLLAAGLKGIEQGYELPPELTENLYDMTPEQLLRTGIDQLPGSLNEAVDAMAGSELVRDALGEHVFEWFLRNKRSEWSAYKTHVSQFELERYLPSL
jgi:glutamine synthetase